MPKIICVFQPSWLQFTGEEAGFSRKLQLTNLVSLYLNALNSELSFILK